MKTVGRQTFIQACGQALVVGTHKDTIVQQK